MSAIKNQSIKMNQKELTKKLKESIQNSKDECLEFFCKLIQRVKQKL